MDLAAMRSGTWNEASLRYIDWGGVKYMDLSVMRYMEKDVLKSEAHGF